MWSPAAYIPLYAFGVPYVRSLTWVASMVGIVMDYRGPGESDARRRTPFGGDRGPYRDRDAAFPAGVKRWGEAARYAGSKDRAFVSGLVLDVPAPQALAGLADGRRQRARVALGVLPSLWDWPPERVADAAAEEHGPAP
jgi:hypothetical protein